MSNHLGTLEITCDCPPYAIVEACSRVGIEWPEDVRWTRLSHFLTEPPSWRELFHLESWKYLLGLSDRRRSRSCVCGQPLPCLARYSFTYNTGVKESYLLGQCGRCRTIFWEEP